MSGVRCVCPTHTYTHTHKTTHTHKKKKMPHSHSQKKKHTQKTPQITTPPPPPPPPSPHTLTQITPTKQQHKNNHVYELTSTRDFSSLAWFLCYRHRFSNARFSQSLGRGPVTDSLLHNGLSSVSRSVSSAALSLTVYRPAAPTPVH